MKTKSEVGAVDLSLGLAATTLTQVLEKQFVNHLDIPWAKERSQFEAVASSWNEVLPAPAFLFQADEIIDSCPALAKCIASMKTNVAGHGWGLRARIEVKEDMSNLVWQNMQREKVRLESFIENLSLDYSTTELFELLAEHLERYANAYWQIIRDPNGRVVSVHPIENPKRMRLCKKDAQPSVIRHKRRVGTNYEYVNTQRRFRRYVLLGANGEKTYFRQYGDTRQLNSKTGKYGNFETVPPQERANEILHFRLPHADSEYGIVRWISVLVDALSIKVAKLCNLEVLDNGGTPPMAIVITGSSDKTLEQRIRDQVEEIRKKRSRSRVLIIQVDNEEVGVAASEDVLQPKVSFENLAQIMIKEGMFMDFQKYSASEIFGVYRIPPLLLGDLEQVPNKSTAQEAKRIAQEQVFGPAQRKIEEPFNRFLGDGIIHDRAETGVMYWDLFLHSLNADQTETTLAVMKEAREGGAITPNQEHAVLASLVPEHKLPDLPDDPRNDVPVVYNKGLSKTELDGPTGEAAKAFLAKALGRPVQKATLIEYNPDYDDVAA